MRAKVVAIALLSALYVIGSHWLMTSAPPSPWNVVLLLTPMLAAIAFAAWQAGQRIRALLAVAAIVALSLLPAFGVHVPAALLYLGQHVGINLVLGVWFASTLRAGGEPLITMLAGRVHRHMPPAMLAYTRNVTRAWVVYFFAMAAASVLLYVGTSFAHWAEFANLGSPIALGAMFIGERLLRYRLHPGFERTSIADAIRAYSQGRATVAPAAREPAP
jgi:uncharacterized membrane protein